MENTGVYGLLGYLGPSTETYNNGQANKTHHSDFGIKTGFNPCSPTGNSAQNFDTQTNRTLFYGDTTFGYAIDEKNAGSKHLTLGGRLDVNSGIIGVGNKGTNGVGATNSIRMGSGTSLDAANDADKAITIGVDSGATAENATTIGHGTKAGRQNAFAIGTNANASGNSAVAVGSGAGTSANSATAVGNDAKATATDASAYGHIATAKGISASAFGHGANAEKDHTVAVGSASQATSWVRLPSVTMPKPPPLMRWQTVKTAVHWASARLRWATPRGQTTKIR